MRRGFARDSELFPAEKPERQKTMERTATPSRSEGCPFFEEQWGIKAVLIPPSNILV